MLYRFSARLKSVLLLDHLIECLTHVVILHPTEPFECLRELVIRGMSKLESLLHLFVLLFHSVILCSLGIDLLKVLNEFLLLSILFSLLQLVVKLGLNLRDSAVLVLLPEQQVLHLGDLLISLFKLLRRNMLQRLKLHGLQIFLRVQTLLLQFLLNLFLKLGACLVLTEVGSDLIDRVKTDTTALSDHISRSEVKLIYLAIVLNLRDPLADLLFDGFIVFLTLYLQPLPSTHGCS